MKKTLLTFIIFVLCLVHTVGLGFATFGGIESNGGIPAAVFTASYGPHGEDWGSTGVNPTPFTWLGGYGVMSLDDGTPLKLYLTRYRLYSATLNRFLSSDPLGLEGGPNLYEYGASNPMAYIDPLGLCAQGMSMYGFGVMDNLYDMGVFALGELSTIGHAIAGTAAGLSNLGLWTMETLRHPEHILDRLIDANNYFWDNVYSIPSAVSAAWDSGYYGQGQVIGGVLITAGTLATPFASAGRAATAAPAAARPINVSKLELTKTVEGHGATRPYINSPLTAQEIMAARPPISDPQGVPGALRWDVPGAYNGSQGIWELVVNPNQNQILHWLFKSQ